MYSNTESAISPDTYVRWGCFVNLRAEEKLHCDCTAKDKSWRGRRDLTRTWKDDAVCLCAYQSPANAVMLNLGTVGGLPQAPSSNAGMFPTEGRLMSIGQNSGMSTALMMSCQGNTCESFYSTLTWVKQHFWLDSSWINKTRDFLLI